MYRIKKFPYKIPKTDAMRTQVFPGHASTITIVWNCRGGLYLCKQKHGRNDVVYFTKSEKKELIRRLTNQNLPALEWEYSRNQGRHYVRDGKIYNLKGGGFDLWQIRDCTPRGMVRQCHKQGYDLFYKGKRIKHDNTVKKLKTLAEIIRRSE